MTKWVRISVRSLSSSAAVWSSEPDARDPALPCAGNVIPTHFLLWAFRVLSVSTSPIVTTGVLPECYRSVTLVAVNLFGMLVKYSLSLALS